MRTTKRRPLQSPSMAHTLLSTSPRGRATARITSSVRSTCRGDDFFGQAIHRAPVGRKPSNQAREHPVEAAPVRGERDQEGARQPRVVDQPGVCGERIDQGGQMSGICDHPDPVSLLYAEFPHQGGTRVSGAHRATIRAVHTLSQSIRPVAEPEQGRDGMCRVAGAARPGLERTGEEGGHPVQGHPGLRGSSGRCRPGCSPGVFPTRP